MNCQDIYPDWPDDPEEEAFLAELRMLEEEAEKMMGEEKLDALPDDYPYHRILEEWDN